jgi:integrase
MPEHLLWQRGHQWYLRLPIPRPLQQHFLSANGKPKQFIATPLSESISEARRRRDELVVAYRRVFDRLEAGEAMTAEQIEAEVKLDLLAETKRMYEGALTTLRGGISESDVDSIFGAHLESEVAETAQRVGATDPASVKRIRVAALQAKLLAAMTHGGELLGLGATATRPTPVIEPTTAETVNQAAEVWVTEMQRDPSAAVKATTLEGHRLRVRAFVEQCGDVPLATVTRAMASDFLAKIAAGGLANRTVNNYATTLSCVFTAAKDRGRFSGDNPFERQKRKAGGESYVAFEPSDIHKLFAALPCETAPKKHTPETALPWAVRIAAYTGMRLEEIAQLSAADIRTKCMNGGTVIGIDIHNGGNNSLKTESSARFIPLHSELVRAGLVNYVKALPQGGLLFPGLTRRASKGNKVGARLGELFRKKLIALGMKRDGLCFHSFRHTVGQRLEAAGVSETDTARILGHAIAGESYGTYSSGPGLKRLAAVVEAISYE